MQLSYAQAGILAGPLACGASKFSLAAGERVLLNSTILADKYANSLAKMFVEVQMCEVLTIPDEDCPIRRIEFDAP